MGDGPSDSSRLVSQMPSTSVIVHVPGNHLMNREYNNDCGSVIQKTDIETWHTRIAYARPFGNTDPDHDPDWYSRLQPGIGAKPVVSCR